MKHAGEQKEKQYRTIYDALDETPRIKTKTLATILGITPVAASRRLKEALDFGYVLSPQLRKRSFSNMKEYMYFFDCSYPFDVYKEYVKNMDIVYHAVMKGFANFWVISNKEITIDGDIKGYGLRTDYHIAYAVNRSWDETMPVMQKRVAHFDPKDYAPRGIIGSHWDETIEWDAEDEILFGEFKYDLRKKLSPIMKTQLISAGEIYKFFDKMHQCCSVYTQYFPETIAAYDSYLFMFETDYEDFVIDLFSALPTSSFFFKVSNKLFLNAHMKKTFVRDTTFKMSDVSRLPIICILDSLLKKKIIRNVDYSIVEYHFGRDPYPGDPLPSP